MKEFDDRVNREVLDGFVTWSALEDALKGLKQEFEPPAVQPDDFMNVSTGDLNRSTDQHFPALVGHTSEETDAQDRSYGSLKDLVND